MRYFRAKSFDLIKCERKAALVAAIENIEKGVRIHRNKILYVSCKLSIGRRVLVWQLHKTERN